MGYPWKNANKARYRPLCALCKYAMSLSRKVAESAENRT
jgi:hypothetical protein